MEMALPLPYQQLTRLRLEGRGRATANILAMIPELPQLKELEIASGRAINLSTLDAAMLSRWPQLRLVNLSETRLWESKENAPEKWNPDTRGYAPMAVVEQLMHLQRACPRIEWVLHRPEQHG
jgi:hypothetical protein